MELFNPVVPLCSYNSSRDREQKHVILLLQANSDVERITDLVVKVGFIMCE